MAYGFTFVLRAQPGDRRRAPWLCFRGRPARSCARLRVTPASPARWEEAGRGAPRRSHFRRAASRAAFVSKTSAVRLERIEQAEDPVASRHGAPIRAPRSGRTSRDPDLPHGIIHGDLFRDNILWENGEPVALLDFESACDGSWVYDLMVTVLAWCYGSDLDEHWCARCSRGYASVRASRRPSWRALGTEGRIAALRFTVTRITDFAMRPRARRTGDERLPAVLGATRADRISSATPRRGGFE